MPERDYPIGHPAASDYSGTPYVDPHAIFGFDYPPGHPARGGKNINPLDTPDGMRAAHNAHTQDLVELAAVQSLPPLIDPDTKEPVTLTPEELALVYKARMVLRPALALKVTAEYGLTPDPNAGGADASGQMSVEQQALRAIVGRGYTPERAKELLDKYGVPDTLLEMERDAHR